MKDKTLSQAVKQYIEGSPVVTRELSGMGASYELVMQCLLWESLVLLDSGLRAEDAVEQAAQKLNETLFFSGAQVGFVRKHVEAISKSGMRKWMPDVQSRGAKMHARWWPACPLPMRTME
jgi:hypothetical protein